MKKIISLIMVVCLMATIGMATASADSVNGGTTTITYKEPDTYCVLIPETIDMTFYNYRFQATDMNLAEGDEVFVTMGGLDENNYFPLTHENGVDTARKKVYYDYGSIPTDRLDMLPAYCVGYFSDEDTISRMGFMMINDGDMHFKAGNYTGTAEFTVELRESV
jgi:uncharacterized protein YxeA